MKHLFPTLHVVFSFTGDVFPEQFLLPGPGVYIYRMLQIRRVNNGPDKDQGHYTALTCQRPFDVEEEDG